MKCRARIKAIVVLGMLTLVLFSCRKNGSSGWSAQELVPLVSSTLSLQNLVSDTVLKINSDSSLTLAYQSTLYQFNLANQIVQIPDTSIGQKFTLDSLALPSSTIPYNLTLGNLANNLVAGGGLGASLGNYILSNNTHTVTIPPLGPLSTGGFSFNAAAYFDSAYIKSGQIQVWVVNHLPIPISAGAIVSLYNQNDTTTPVVSDTTTQPICAWNTTCQGSADSIYFVININNCTFITSNLIMKISNLNTPGSNGAVYIDTNQYLQMRMYLYQSARLPGLGHFSCPKYS